MQTATIILEQIGQKALTMIGAKTFVEFENGVQFFIGRNAKRITKIRILYDAGLDLYSIEFYKGRGINLEFVKSALAFYAEQLTTAIESNTGLATKL